MNKKHNFCINIRKFALSSITIASLGILFVNNSETVHSASLTGSQSLLVRTSPINVKLEYRDTAGKLLSPSSQPKSVIPGSVILPKADFDQVLALYSSQGYSFIAAASTIVPDSNGDLVLPNTVTTDQTYTIVFQANSTPVRGGNVTVHYQDENGNKLTDDEVWGGDIGDTYSSRQKPIDGYSFKLVKGQAAGYFTRFPQSLTYIYTKDEISDDTMKPVNPVEPAIDDPIADTTTSETVDPGSKHEVDGKKINKQKVNSNSFPVRENNLAKNKSELPQTGQDARLQWAMITSGIIAVIIALGSALKLRKHQ